MLQIVVHGYNHVVFCRSNAAEQRIMLSVVAHEIDSTNGRRTGSQAGNDVLLRSRLQSFTRITSCCSLIVQHFAKAVTQFREHGLAIVNRDHDRESTAVWIAKFDPQFSNLRKLRRTLR